MDPPKISQTAICRDPRNLESNGSNSKKSAEGPENSRAQIAKKKKSKIQIRSSRNVGRVKMIMGDGFKNQNRSLLDQNHKGPIFQ